MDQSLQFVRDQRVARTLKALEANRFEACYVSDRRAALEKLLSMMEPGASVTHGGSVTLTECGVPAALRRRGLHYLERDAPGNDAAAKEKICRQAFSADYYLGSVNAVTERGELFNVDGTGNRVAAYLYGPRHVLLIAGVNKIVPDIEAAVQRLRKTAAPANAARLSCSTPCAKTGECMDCRAPGRICCDYVVQGHQRAPGRIKIILVGETLGY